jgi:hypothetical protein
MVPRMPLPLPIMFLKLSEKNSGKSQENRPFPNSSRNRRSRTLPVIPIPEIYFPEPVLNPSQGLTCSHHIPQSLRRVFLCGPFVLRHFPEKIIGVFLNCSHIIPRHQSFPGLFLSLKNTHLRNKPRAFPERSQTLVFLPKAFL